MHRGSRLNGASLHRFFQAAGILILAALLHAPPTARAAGLAEPGIAVRGFRPGYPFRSPRGIALNLPRSEIVLANTEDHRIEIFSLEGRPLARFPHRVRSAGGALVDGLPRGVAVDAAGRILVVDNLAPYVDVLDTRGRSIAEIPTPVPAGAGGLAAIAVARSGAILVAGPGDQGRVFLFGPSPDYTLLDAWGEAGTAPGRLSSITALAELPDGTIAVACAQTDLAIQLFSPSGEFLRGFGRHEIGPGNVSLPSGIAVTSDGRIWISDELRQTVQVFDPSGTLLGSFGGTGTGPGDFLYPSALATDGESRLVVAERVGGRFQLFHIGDRVADPNPERR